MEHHSMQFRAQGIPTEFLFSDVREDYHKSTETISIELIPR